MEDRDLHALAQFLLNVEALGRFDIFKVNPTKSRFQRGDHVDQFIRVKLINFDIEHIDTRKLFKQNAFAFHHWLTRQGTDVT